MIGRISGQVLKVQPPQVLVDVSGIGYEIDLPIPDCTSLPAVGANIIIYTHLVIREDAHSLYGFLTQNGRDCFRQLIKVSGIGPRIGLALLSSLSLNELELALANSDIDVLCRAPGVGKKMAERMLLELKGKLYFDNEFKVTADGVITAPDSGKMIRNDISNALLSLGYADKEIKEVLKNLPLDIIDLSSGIKEALKLLNRF
jgi:holliday junction DNA helicase RuvA